MLVEPDKLIPGLAELIQRTVGPQIDVNLRLNNSVWAVLCDPRELETALLNLAINARDAMPEGGRLPSAAQTCASPRQTWRRMIKLRRDYVEIKLA